MTFRFDSVSFCNNNKPEKKLYSVHTNELGQLSLIIATTPAKACTIVFQGSFEDCITYLDDNYSIDDCTSALNTCITL